MTSSLGKMRTTSVRAWFGESSAGGPPPSRGQAFGETHEGKNIGFGLIPGKLGDLGPELISHLPPLGAGHFGILVGKDGGDEGGDPPAVFAGMAQDIAREVHGVAAIAGPSGAFRDRRAVPPGLTPGTTMWL
jgi:hypothetical protein